MATKIISTAQKTFIDLYDAYTLDMDTDVIALECDQYGKASKQHSVTTSYGVKIGSETVSSTCNLIDTNMPAGISVNISSPGKIIITIAKNTTIEDDFKIGIRISTTDDNGFTFDRYITFVKVKKGEKAVTFKIYSENGNVFKEGLDEIKMETAAFDGITQITNATYVWSYYDLNNGKWVAIVENMTDSSEGIGSSLTVFKTNQYSSLIFKCVMTYNGKTYEDYFTLNTFNHTYSAAVKFFNGSNIFDPAEPFIVAYLELYKDHIEEEDILTKHYFYHANNKYDATQDTVNTSSAMDDTYKIDGNLMYIVYNVVNPTKQSSSRYTVRLCQYNGTYNKWVPVDSSYANQYVYQNDLYEEMYNDYISNIVVIPREDVFKSKDINFTVYKKAKQQSSGDDYVHDNDLIIARSHVTVVDLNDPVIGPTAPTDPKEGQLWLDTKTIPYALYIYENESWNYFSQKNGETVFTSRPSKYSQGDLWILAHGETCGTFKEGSILRAKQSSSSFSTSHWQDAISTLTEVCNDIYQNFEFDKDAGVTIGQSDQKFYVNINSKEMGLYDNSAGKHQKVVYISNSAANIDNVVVEGSAKFDCDATFNQQVNFGKFAWQVESDGSLSLVLET